MVFPVYSVKRPFLRGYITRSASGDGIETSSCRTNKAVVPLLYLLTMSTRAQGLWILQHAMLPYF